jgi:hypothetical protein
MTSQTVNDVIIRLVRFAVAGLCTYWHRICNRWDIIAVLLVKGLESEMGRSVLDHLQLGDRSEIMGIDFSYGVFCE